MEFVTKHGNLLCGDSEQLLKNYPDNLFDSVITDPPYSLGFMGKSWDKCLPSIEIWKQCLRVAKPGATLLCFGGTRTYHRLACNLEDVGWEIRDCIMWINGEGMPKGVNISKAIDKHFGQEREVVGTGHSGKTRSVLNAANHPESFGGDYEITVAKSEQAKKWDGWHSALKPAYEPIILAQKPIEGTYVSNAEKYRVAGLNIDECRVPINPEIDDPRLGGAGTWSTDKMAKNVYEGGYEGVRVGSSPLGRFPTNIILDEEAAKALDAQTGVSYSFANPRTSKGTMGYGGQSKDFTTTGFEDSGGASRFFYCSKAKKKERGEGNTHTTVKPLALMEYLCKLTKTPDGGIVLDPFAGSATTAIACIRTNRPFVMIEREKEYFDIGQKRIEEELSR